MPSTYSTSLRLELQADGENAGTWGQKTNTNLGTLIEQAVSGWATIAVTGATVLTALNGLTDQARNAVLNLTNGGVAAPFTVTVPAHSKLYVFDNQSGQTATITGGGTTVAIATARRVAVYVDTSGNVAELVNSISSIAGATFSGVTAITGGAFNEVSGANIASAATTAIGAATGNYVNVTGTTGITAFDSITAGARRLVNFTGILTLTHNATSLILPAGGASITTAAGDVGLFISLGAGNWICAIYQRASGQALVAAAAFVGGVLTATTTMSAAAFNEASATVASATTTNIGAAAANYLFISGTTTITAFDTIASGATRTLEFQGALTLTHNATTLILPTGASITTAAGDTAIFRSEGSGNWRCISYARATGYGLKGGVVALGKIETGAAATGATVMNYADAIPQITEGNEFMNVAVTPKNASSTLYIDVVFNYTITTSGVTQICALFQDATANALAAVVFGGDTGSAFINKQMTIRHVMTAGTTSSTTFRVRAGNPGGNTTTFNGDSGTRKMGGVFASSIVVTEYLP